MSSLNKDNIIINIQDSNLNNDLSNDLNNNISTKIASIISNKDKKQNTDTANINTNTNKNFQNAAIRGKIILSMILTQFIK